MKIVFSVKAEQCLLDIYDFIAIQNQAPENANKFLNELVEHIKSILELFPQAGVKKSKNTRYLVFKKYVITYRIYKNHILITGIYKGQNWRK